MFFFSKLCFVVASVVNYFKLCPLEFGGNNAKTT